MAGVAPYVLIIIAPSVLAYYYLQDKFLTTSRELKRLDSLAFSPIFANFSETLVGLTSLRAFRKQGQFLAKNCGESAWGLGSWVIRPASVAAMFGSRVV